MSGLKFDLPLKVGLLLTTLSWLTYIFYDLNISINSRHTTFPLFIEDFPGAWGLCFRMGAATIALVTVILFVFKQEISHAEAIMALRFVLLFETLYFIGFLGGAFNFWKRYYFTLPRIFDEGLPCFVLGFLLPAVLIKLFSELNPNKPKKGAIKWALIYVAAFLFAFWFNNMGEWVGTVLSKGVGYLTQYPINLLSFLVTVVGLFVLFLYAADFSSKWLPSSTIGSLNLRKISTMVTLLGLYPLFIFLLWLFFGAVGGWGIWYAWFLGHGYMTFIALPITFTTLPLLFRSHAKYEDAKLGIRKKTTLNFDKKQLTLLLFLTQALGVTFFIVFSLAYYIPIPSTHFLIGAEPFLSLEKIFGILFLIFALTLTFLSYKTKITDKQKTNSSKNEKSNNHP
jgi:hypothetical protein